jgi:hypothetical protein
MPNFLNEKDQKLFFKIHKNLLLFVNKKIKSSKKFKDLSDWGKYANFMSDAIVLRNHLFRNKDIIDQFIEANPANFDEQELSITKHWKGAIIGKFILLKHLKNHSIFLNTERNKAKVYAVLGLMGSIDEVAPKYQLPIFVDTVLIPFSGRIVYDGILQGYNVIIGNGYTRSFMEDYKLAKEEGGIITDLLSAQHDV